jgi:hypothetical protein
MTGRPVPQRHRRSYGTEPLPTGSEALGEPFSALPPLQPEGSTCLGSICLEWGSL